MEDTLKSTGNRNIDSSEPSAVRSSEGSLIIAREKSAESYEESAVQSALERQARILHDEANLIVQDYYYAQRQAQRHGRQAEIEIPEEFKQEFFSLVDKVCLSLLEDRDNFFGFFLMQMSREISFEIASPTAVNFQKASYVIYFNPLIFLNLTLAQMECTIKHEILHIVSGHLIRAKEFKGRYSTLAVNMAMDVVVNTFLDHLPPYSVTLEWVNRHYSLELLPFKPFEYYVEELQTALDLIEAEEEAEKDRDVDEQADEHNDEHSDDQSQTTDSIILEEREEDPDLFIVTEFNPEKTHDYWQASDDLDDRTLQEFTEKFVAGAQKGYVPNYLQGMIASFKSSRGELPWNLYLKRLMGTVESQYKKTVTRRNRRQPERLDLRGQLRSHKPKVIVALDISGSISDEEFYQAMKEVLAIVKNYNHEITVVECDSEIRRVYQVKTVKDLQERSHIRGGTRFTPVFEYANKHKANLLIYFTDGKGEEELLTKPRGYKVLWVISGRGDELSVKEPCGAVKRLKNVEIIDETMRLSDVKRDGYSMQDMERMDF